MVAGVERDAIARERRRRQALELLEFEQEREAALREQLDELITEQHGSEVDDSAFASMSPEDVKVVREALVGSDDPPEVDEVEAALSEWPEETTDDADDVEAEIARLEAELAECRRRQQSFERYLEALDS
jgi:hypothetical protein